MSRVKRVCSPTTIFFKQSDAHGKGLKPLRGREEERKMDADRQCWRVLRASVRARGRIGIMRPEGVSEEFLEVENTTCSLLRSHLTLHASQGRYTPTQKETITSCSSRRLYRHTHVDISHTFSCTRFSLLRLT